MALIVARPSPLRDAIAQVLSQCGGAAAIEPEHDDPFGAAVHHRAIVYLPAPSLNGRGEAACAARMGAVLSAAQAPGVETVIVVLPLEGYDEELQLLKRAGKPYVILRAPMLLEALGQELDGHSLWVVERDIAIRAVSADTVARAVSSAIDSDDHGRTIELPGDRLPAPAALEKAASATRKPVRVLATWAPLVRMLWWLARLFGRAEPPALHALRRAALPASRLGGPGDGMAVAG